MSDARTERFNDVLEQIEVSAYSIRTGREHDIYWCLTTMLKLFAEAAEIFAEVSREALEEKVNEGKS